MSCRKNLSSSNPEPSRWRWIWFPALLRRIRPFTGASFVQPQNSFEDSPPELTDPPRFGRREKTAIRLTLFRRSLLTEWAQFLIRLPSLQGDRKRLEISKCFAGVDLRKSISRESLRREYCTGSFAPASVPLRLQDDLRKPRFHASAFVV